MSTNPNGANQPNVGESLLSGIEATKQAIVELSDEQLELVAGGHLNPNWKQAEHDGIVGGVSGLAAGGAVGSMGGPVGGVLGATVGGAVGGTVGFAGGLFKK